MRSTASRRPIRANRRRLLESCAIAAGLAALAHGGPALAQVAGNPVFVDVGVGSSVSSNGGTNSTTVTVTQDQSIINWVPTDTAPTGGAIDFLPAGATWNFVGNGDYTVLNRFTNGAGGSLSRQIALSGTVNSYVGSTTGPQGGNIWFYNAGGILINGGAAINVGSLVLTANDIDTTGGLFGAGGEIRFRGAPNSTSTVQIAAGASIDAAKVGNPGGSYVALVAPRIVQGGAVTVDGSAAYVAAEQADIRINGGLFDINVLVGAEGGNAITHTGTTRGPAHQQDDSDQNRIYMVAIPKNDAVSMLVSGQVGYDDAAVAQTDPDGAVVLSAGYNITGGEIDAAPVNAAAANITVNDTIFRSDTIAHASGDFLGQPLATIPSPGGAFVPPPQLGLVLVQGSGTFIGDASATFNVGPGRLVGATGDLTLIATGSAGAPGTAAVNVTGGTLATTGSLSIYGDAALDPIFGDATGGSASLSITAGLVQTAALTVGASAQGDLGVDGNAGDGFGGTASIDIDGAGSTLQAGSVTVSASGTGGGLFDSGGGVMAAVDDGGDGFGGSATIAVRNGGTLNATDLVTLDAGGFGQTGMVQSGAGTGGDASLDVSGAATFYTAGATSLGANGTGGGLDASLDSAQGGTGTGGTAAIRVDADTGSSVQLGNASLIADGEGGHASSVENLRGGDAVGGQILVGVDGGAAVEADDLFVSVAANSGGGTSPSGLTGRSGDAQGGTIDIDATGGTQFQVDGGTTLYADAQAAVSDIVGGGSGGTIALHANNGGSIVILGGLEASASANSNSSVVTQASGGSTGGAITFEADAGAISARDFLVSADGQTANVEGAGGIAQGGTIDLLASNDGSITGTSPSSFSYFSAGAQSGVSADGTNAIGGTVQIIANGGGIDLGGFVDLYAGGVSGGASVFGGGAVPVGRGGTILLQALADPTDSSALDFDNLSAAANGSSSASIEGSPGLGGAGAGNGEGGIALIDIQGGRLTATQIDLGAGGSGGGVGPNSGIGRGGRATFTQSAGVVTVDQLTIAADGEGGEDFTSSGTGFGGTATINLAGGTLTGGNIRASAGGLGGFGSSNDDFNPDNVAPAGAGGDGVGGNATINLEGTAIVNVGSLTADATGEGRRGGDFYTYNDFAGDGGDGGNGSGGQATINIVSGTLNTGDLSAIAAGIGGGGGSFSSSSGASTGTGVGGDGGIGSGGTATINFLADISTGGAVSTSANGSGGFGGSGLTGGNGGDGLGGLAQVVVIDNNPGILDASIISTGSGGGGGFGSSGGRGDGGDGAGGTARAEARGAAGAMAVDQTNFVTDGNGGNGRNGGNGIGGTLEVVASAGAQVGLGDDSSGPVPLSSTGTGGSGDETPNSRGGDGIGGTVHLFANGGTIGSAGRPVVIAVSGGAGAGATAGTTTGGRAVIDALGGPATGGSIVALGDTTISANGDNAGRIELRSDGNLTLSSLNAEALGAADPTNNDTEEASSGIFLGAEGGAIAAGGGMTLTTGGSVGIYAQGAGSVGAGDDITIAAGDQIDIRHDGRGGTAPTIGASGDLTATAATGISGASGSLIDAGGSLTLTAATIAVDHLHGGNVTLDSSGATTVEHAESDDDLTADVGSFATGLNSIITGGDIVINAPGAVDLGNSTAGGFVFVDGQTIDFNAIDAGKTVTLRANGFGTSDGVTGTDITAGGAVSLSGGSIDIAGTIGAASPVSVTANSGNAAVALVDADGSISAFAGADLTGVYRSGGNVVLGAGGNVTAEADAAGTYVDPNGIPTEGYVFADADGNATLTNSSAATMLAVRSGGAATVTGSSAGEDLFVLAGTTATVANVTAGDDIAVTSTGAMAVSDAATTGTGADDRSVVYAACCSNPIPVLQIVTSAPDLSNVTLSAPAAAIAASNVTAFDNLTATAGGAVTGTGQLRSGLATSITGANLDLGAITAGTDIVLGATAGDIAATGTLAAGHDLTLDAAANIAVAELDAGDDVRLSAGGTLSAGAVFSHGTGLDNDGDGSNVAASAGGALTFTGAIDSANAVDLAGGSVSTQAVGAASDVTIDAAAGGIATGDMTAGGALTLTASGAVSTGDLGGNSGRITAGGAATLGDVDAVLGFQAQGSSVTAGDLAVTNGDLYLIATAGGIGSTGTIDTGGAFFANATGAVDLPGDITAGGIIQIFGGSIAAGNVTANGSYLQLDAASGPIIATGTVSSGRDIAIGTAAGGSFNRLIAGDDIEIQGSGDVTIAFMDASGDNPGGEEIGSNAGIFLDGNVSIGQASAADNFTANVAGFTVGPDALAAGGNITVEATGNIVGAFDAGGDILLTSNGNITASAIARGGYLDPSSDTPFAGNLYVDADGNVALTDSSAADMLGVHAGGSVALTNAAAGEDMLILAGTTATLSALSAGDDIDVRAGGAIAATGITASGAGPDGFQLFYSGGGNFTIGQGEGSSALDGADIEMTSDSGAIAAAGLSAGDDIVLRAATTLALSGAGTQGIGVTGGDSSIRTQSASATLASLDAADDIIVDTTGAASATAPLVAGRDIAVTAGSADFATLTNPAGGLVDTLRAGGTIAVATTGDIGGGALRAGGDLTLSAGGAIAIAQAIKEGAGTLSLDGNAGVAADLLVSQGETALGSSDGAIAVASLSSTGQVAAFADSIAIDGNGVINFASLVANTGDAVIDVSGELFVTSGTVAGTADLTGRGERLAVQDLDAADVRLTTTGFMDLGNVTAANGVAADAAGSILVNGVVTGTSVSLGSSDISIASGARVGTAGVTQALDVRNTSDDRTTYIGGTGTRDGYHLDAAELTQLFGTNVTIFAPQVDANDEAFVAAGPGALFVPIASIGSSAAPDVIVEDFSLAAGGATSNLGATGSLTISTPGKMRVIGAAELTGAGSGNSLTLSANDAIEVILGEGSVRLTDANGGPAGRLNLQSNDVIVATLGAIGDVAAAGSIDEIETRLAQSDGIVSNDGALFAGGIDVGVVGGFYVQNSGAGTDYGARRGLTFGSGGLNIATEGSTTRIVLNGVQLGAQGQITGLDTIPQLRVNGAIAASGGLDARSTFNGCVILATGACSFVPPPPTDIEMSFPVQDVIEEETDPDGDDGDGTSLPTALITMRDIDPMTGEPLIDDPVTGAGNDDLWTPPAE